MENEKLETVNKDEKLIAVVSHAIGCLVIPLLVYLLKKDSSPFLKAQVKQALVWQAVMFVGFGLVSSFITVLAGFTFGLGGLFYLLLPPAGLIVFCIGLYAAYKVGQGEAYEYPFIKSLVDSF